MIKQIFTSALKNSRKENRMTRTKFRRVISSFLVIAFVATLFPVSAFAEFDSNARIYATHLVDGQSASKYI